MHPWRSAISLSCLLHDHIWFSLPSPHQIRCWIVLVCNRWVAHPDTLTYRLLHSSASLLACLPACVLRNSPTHSLAHSLAALLACLLSKSPLTHSLTPLLFCLVALHKCGIVELCIAWLDTWLVVLCMQDVDLLSFAKLVCSILDIPVFDNPIESMHILFTLLLEFKNNPAFKPANSTISTGQKFSAHANSRSNSRGDAWSDSRGTFSAGRQSADFLSIH